MDWITKNNRLASLPLLKRRSFFKIGAAAYFSLISGCSSRASRSSPSALLKGEREWASSVCTLCSSACAVRAYFEGGRIVAVGGEPDDPNTGGRMCPIGLSMLNLHTNPDRLMRAHRKNPDGGNAPAQAEDIIASIAGKIRQGGSLHIYGKITPYAFHISKMLKATCHRDPQSEGMPAYPPWLNTDGRPPVLDFANARIALLFDSNILEHGYPYVGYVRRIAEARLRGLRLVTLSPFLTNTATAGDWIPIRSQASASLASLALAQQALHDQGRRFASLPQEIANLLQSLDRSFLEKATGLSIETIRELSRRFFGEPGPAASDIPDPAVLLLNIMKGNLKSFGGLYHPGPQMLRVDSGFGDIASLLRDSRNVVFLHQSNPAFSLAHEIRPILRSSERATLVCVDSFMSETTELSDFVLPLASPLETLTITEPFPLHWHFIAATLPVVKPSGSCRSFDDWLVHLAAAISGVAPPLTPRQFATEAVLGNSPGGLAAGEAIYRKHIVVDGPVIQAQFPAIISSLKTRMELIHKLPSMLNAPLRPEQCFLTAFEESVRGPATAPSKWLDEISYSQKIFLHPQRAGRLGIKSGDAITLTGDSGAPVEGIALLFEGVHPDALAIPMHHGHTGYGRVARGDRFSDSDDSDMSRMFWGKNPGINPAGFNGSIVSIRKKRG